MELSTLVKEVDVKAFADDIMVITHGRAQTTKAIDIVYNWADKNSMEVNKDKSQIVQLRKRAKETSKITKINGLQTGRRYKYLGVFFDNALTMNDMFEQLETKLNHFSQHVERLSLRKISMKMRFNLFQTYASSHLNYIAGIIPAMKSVN